MDCISQKHHRHSIRLKKYNYSQLGSYFITICTYQLRNLLGEIINKQMVLNPKGKIVYDEWMKTASMRKNIRLDEFVVMPNHIHGIITIVMKEYKDIDEIGTYEKPIQQFGQSTKNSIPTIVKLFKSATTRQIKLIQNQKRPKIIWQRNYYEHVIRNEEDLNRIKSYIQNNPLQWELDENNIFQC